MLQIFMNHTTDGENSIVKVLQIKDDKGNILSAFDEKKKMCDFSVLKHGDEINIFHKRINMKTNQVEDWITHGFINEVSRNKNGIMYFQYSRTVV